MGQHMLKWFMTNFEKPKPGEVARIIIMVAIAGGVYVGLHGWPH